MADVDDGSRISDTCKECSSCLIPDGAPNASRSKSDDGGATPDYVRKSDDPAPKCYPSGVRFE